MKKITDFTYASKKVILRCDFNVTIKNGKILSDEKIKSSLETINYLIKHKAIVIIMSHLGKIKTEKDKEENSLYIVYQRLCKLLDTKVIFSSVTRGKILEDKIASLNPGEVLLMENTRFEDLNNESESKCNVGLCKYWASLGDIFINDAFGMTHRRHASNYGLTKYMPSGIGFLIEKEIEGLKIVTEPKHPFIVIMGGAKVDDKIDLIENILPKCEYLLIGGGIANSFLAINHNIGKSLINKEKSKEIKSLLYIYKEKIIIPSDVKVLDNEKVVNKKVEDIQDSDIIYDIGSETVENFKKYVFEAKTIFINGTVGMYEDDRFADGTKEILEAVSKSKAKSVIGGGDALSSAEHFKINDFDFISTGGGATLDYIGSGKLKCMED
jgi:phosphoglycerate kinase